MKNLKQFIVPFGVFSFIVLVMSWWTAPEYSLKATEFEYSYNIDTIFRISVEKLKSSSTYEKEYNIQDSTLELSFDKKGDYFLMSLGNFQDSIKYTRVETDSTVNMETKLGTWYLYSNKWTFKGENISQTYFK